MTRHMMARCVMVFLVLCVVIFGGMHSGYANWQTDGVPVCTADNTQNEQQIVADGNGGAIIVWEDKRYDTNRDIYSQRIGAYGEVLWAVDSVPVCIASFVQWQMELVSDGAGGAIITWSDGRVGYKRQIFAQRIGADGKALWTEDGVRLCETGHSPHIASDGAGGAIIAWHTDGEDKNIYARRIAADGQPLWIADGVAICTAADEQVYPRVAVDGAGGAIIVWEDCRDAGTNSRDLYVQRVNADGDTLWAKDGVAVCALGGVQEHATRIIPDGESGAIIVWEDCRDAGTNSRDLYVQRVNADGDTLWAKDGVAVCALSGIQEHARIIPDGEGGAIITWADRRSGDWDIYAQRIDADGNALWTEDSVANGVAICTAPFRQAKPQITPDNTGGAIIAWQDERGVDNSDIYAQRVDSSGTALWSTNGYAVCRAANCQESPQLVSDGDDGAIVAWVDYRQQQGEGYEDIYAMRIMTLPRCVVTRSYIYEDPWQDEFLFGCPQGDGYALRVTTEFNSQDLSEDIPPEAITLDRVEVPFRFWNSGPITADSAATLENGYTTTITHSSIGGSMGCGMGHVPVRLYGMEVGLAESVYVKSPDYTGDGVVSLSDLGYFGETYCKGPGDQGYNDCFDFTADDTITTSDLDKLATHYYYHQLPAASPLMLAELSGDSDIGVRIDIESPGSDGSREKRCVTVYLEGVAEATTICIGIDIDPDALVFDCWKPNPGCRGTSAAVPIVTQGAYRVFLASFEVDPPGGGEIELGTLEFFVGDTGGPLCMLDGSGSKHDEISIAFGDVLCSNGAEIRVSRFEYDRRDDVPAAECHLANSYPNPFNPSTTIEYSLPALAHVHLYICNVNGQLVRTLVNKYEERGRYAVVWNGTDNSGVLVASGIYFCTIKTAGYMKANKIVVLR